MEWNAAHVVARVTGERVILQDDGSQMRMPDIRIEHASGDVAYIEVWTDTDQRRCGSAGRTIRSRAPASA